jgi:hypothetical protein
MEFAEAARRVHLNRSVAFFGAGFSRDASNLDGKEMKSSGGLAEILSTALDENETLPLELASQEYVRAKIEPDIRDLIRQSYSANSVSGYQKHLSSLPWQRMYTTNYDNVLEKGRRDSGMPVLSATSLEAPAEYSGRNAIVHLHGFVERLTKGDWDNAYVLTDQQYASDILRESGWLETFRNDISYADSIFFFGYSIQDVDIARLMYENPSISEKTFIIAGKTPSRSTEIRTQGYGNLVRLNVEQAASHFPAADDPEASQPAPYLVNLIPVEIIPADNQPSRDDVVNFLIKGDFNEGYAARDLTNGTSEYYVSRDQINSRADTLGTRPERIIVHSRLGSGKTCATMEIAHYLLTAGWSVLKFNGISDGIEYDIDYLANLQTKNQARTALIFENCFGYTDQIKELVERFPMISFFLTSRSAALQTRIGNISEAFGDDFEVIDLNELSEAEAEELNEILYSNGLWGERQGRTLQKRLEYILRTANADLPTLLVDVCRSSDIFARVRAELANLDEHPRDVRKSLIVTLCLSVAGARLNLNQICDVVQADIFKFGKYQSNPTLREFIDFDKGRIIARSATFARAVLRDIIPDHLIIEAIPNVVSRLDRLASENSVYDEALKGMVRFGFIESILGQTGKEAKLVAFYEAIRATGVGASNPQFWLQYAIACMSFSDFENADVHFQAAFGLAEKKGGYDPYQIENQYARFLLESRTQTSKWLDYFEAFKNAHEIIARQMNSFREGFYPYRVARSYLPYVEANNKVFSKAQRERIVGWCEQLIKLGGNAPNQIKRSRYWREADVALKNTIDYLRG